MSTTKTDIAWTDRTWNAVRGCARVSAGCERCYAERQAHRFSGKGQPYEGLTVLGKKGVRWTGEARFIPGALGEPLRWRKPQRIFVNSMSDLFHDDVTNEQIAAVFGVMAACPQHTFQVLTKRPERMVEWFQTHNRQDVLMAALDVERETHPQADGGPLHTKRCADPIGPWPLPNVHLGVSCENQETADKRIPLLLQVPAAVRFISAEPLLGPIDFAYSTFNGADSFGSMPGINWIIAGGESGHGARPCNVVWVRSIVDQCKRAGVACFVKQLGRHVYHDSGALLAHRNVQLRDKKGGDPREWDAHLRVRQMP